MWEPIGAPEKVTYGNNSLAYTGSAFKGVFNGGGHTITNFNATTAVGKDAAFGFFGMLDNAVVKDLTIEGRMTASATGAGAVGVLAGAALSSTVENVKSMLTLISREQSRLTGSLSAVLPVLPPAIFYGSL